MASIFRGGRKSFDASTDEWAVDLEGQGSLLLFAEQQEKDTSFPDQTFDSVRWLASENGQARDTGSAVRERML